jgi:two-component sensor histidine kinase
MPQATLYWDFAITPVRDELGGVEGIVVSGVDVTGQVMNREQLLEEERHRTQLAEALNAEINHRVKNNLAMIAGLLHMQIANLPRNDPAAQMVRQSISRLRAIAAVHEQLNETQLDEVEIVDAIQRIVRAARQILVPDQLDVSVQGAPIYLPSLTATTLCVVVNELLTNAMKHGAAPHRGARAIKVSMGQEDGKLRLGVWNSGNAVADDFDPSAQTQMGLRLVHGIIVEQLRGTFTIAPSDSGTLAQITLSVSALAE